MTKRASCVAGALALLVGVAALAVRFSPATESSTWETLLSPYGDGVPLPDGFRVVEIRRGSGNEVVVALRRPDDRATVEVVIAERGRWKSAHGSRSFTIDYELPRSSAAERDAVTALLAETIASRDQGLPTPAAVPLRAGDSTVIPWWLETLRGTRGMLFGASLVVLALLVLVRSPAVGRAAIALGAIAVTARLAGLPRLRPDVGAAWTMTTSVVLLVLALRGRRFRPVTALWPPIAVAAIALVLRLALGPWGPLHVNGHGARFVADAARDPADIAAHGPGYAEIFGPVAALVPASPDWAIFACNAVLSALVPPLAFAIGLMTGLATSAAIVAALLLAVDPVAIRMGATETYFAAIVFLTTAGSAALLLALHETDAGRRWRAAALVGVGALLVSEAARIHPCAWALMATVPFIVVAGDVGSLRTRLLVLVVAAAMSGGVLLLTSASVLLDVLGNIRSGTLFRPPVPSPSVLIWIAMGAAAYLALAPRRRFALPAAIAVAMMVMTRQAFGASWIWQQSYFRLYLTIPLLAAIACLPPTVFRRRRIALAATPVLVLAWIRFAWPIVAARTTEHLEYRWVREQLRRLAPECRVIHLASAGIRLLMLPTYAGPAREAVAMDLRKPWTIDAALAPVACLYYVHTSLCSTTDGRPACDAIERRLTLVPIARAAFTVGREVETFSYDTRTVETIIARVERVDASSGR